MRSKGFEALKGIKARAFEETKAREESAEEAAARREQEKINKDMLIGFVRLLSPIAPHICEEMHQALTGEETLAYAAWPTYDPAKLVLSEVEIVVQICGKIKAKIMIPADLDKEGMEKLVEEDDTVKALVLGKQIKKIVAVPGKLLNIVAI